MEIYHLKYPDHLTVPEEEYALAIGFFDGLHRGHQAVIEEAVSIAKKRGLTSAVMTFDPHPRHLFNKEQRQLPYITTFEEKVKQLRKMGVDAVFFVTFDWELAALQPSAFIDTFIRRMNVRHVVAGFDFTFGAKGEGTMHDMERLSEGQYETTTIEKVSCDGEKVSSTRIRQAVHDGDMMFAKALLGRFYKVKGTVVSGAARGRTIGFPTANIEVEPSVVLPSKGVYAVLFKVDGATYKGVCNVGVVPTFTDGEQGMTIEVHILHFDEMIYGKTIEIEWVERLRDEQKFDSIEALIVQITNDKEKADDLLTKWLQ